MAKALELYVAAARNDAEDKKSAMQATERIVACMLALNLLEPVLSCLGDTSWSVQQVLR